jgi:hypothetical protein
MTSFDSDHVGTRRSANGDSVSRPSLKLRQPLIPIFTRPLDRFQPLAFDRSFERVASAKPPNLDALPLHFERSSGENLT